MLDTIIRGGYVIDGTGSPWYRGNLGIKDGKIAGLSYVDASQAKISIDVDGLVVSPGFIDMHSHADYDLIVDPSAKPRVLQGITTQVLGSDGISLAPVTEEWKKESRPNLPWMRTPLDWKWASYSGYLARLERQGIATNVVGNVGHVPLRLSATGMEQRPLTKEELGQVTKLACQAMDGGALGITSCLGLPPVTHAACEELIELAKVAGSYSAPFALQVRDNCGDALIQSVKELLSISENSGASVHISEIRPGGKSNRGKIKEILQIIDAARAKGHDITIETYPYISDPVRLGHLFPKSIWDGDMDTLLIMLRNSETRKKLEDSIDLARITWQSTRWLIDSQWDGIGVVKAESNKNQYLEGKLIAEIAAERGEKPARTFTGMILEEEGKISFGITPWCEEDLETFIGYHAAMFGSDGGGDIDPRSYGTFPRLLGKYVRHRKVLSLEDAVRKTTSSAAQRIGIRDRGLIGEGMWADIVIFDPQNIDERGTYANPCQYPTGIHYVFVNGQIVVDKGQHTGALAGKVLRHH